MTDVRENGNHYLSSMDMQLWGMVFTVAIEWQTQIMFTWDRMHVPERRDAYIRFFVPKDSPYRYEIIKFLKGHLDKLQREPATYMFKEQEQYFPGCQCEIHCTIFTFDGVSPEMPVEVSEALSKDFVQRVRVELGSPKRKERAVAKAKEKWAEPGFADKMLKQMSAMRLEEILKDD